MTCPRIAVALVGVMLLRASRTTRRSFWPHRFSRDEIPLVRASVRVAGGDQPGLIGECDERGAVAAVEFAQDVADVGLCGERADDEPPGDLGVAEALGDEAEDLAFAVGQLGE